MQGWQRTVAWQSLQIMGWKTRPKQRLHSNSSKGEVPVTVAQVAVETRVLRS